MLKPPKIVAQPRPKENPLPLWAGGYQIGAYTPVLFHRQGAYPVRDRRARPPSINNTPIKQAARPSTTHPTGGLYLPPDEGRIPTGVGVAVNNGTSVTLGAGVDVSTGADVGKGVDVDVGVGSAVGDIVAAGKVAEGRGVLVGPAACATTVGRELMAPV